MAQLLRGIVCLLSISSVVLAASSWSFSDAALAVGPKGKDATASYTFSASAAVDEIVEFAPADTLRLTFTTKEGSSTARPHQDFLLIEDPSSQLELALPISVKPSGKAKLDLEYRDVPAQLLYADSLTLSLILASFGDSTPSKLEIASVKPIIDEEASPAKPSPPERWGPKPEITHTFRQPQKLPNIGVSAIFAAAVAAGLPLFAALLLFASANVSSFGEALKGAPVAHTIFVASLVTFEIRFFKFWLNGTLGQILLEIAIIGTVAFLSGRKALVEVARRRNLKA